MRYLRPEPATEIPRVRPPRPASRLSEALRLLAQPVSEEKRRLLERRFEALAPELRTDRQVVGRQMSHCAYLMGPAYCSFGCTHCYLPRNANRVPLPTLEDVREQIDANRLALGPDGALQITGGDVIDAYWRAGRPEELVEIVRYACDRGLSPMLMTHGQKLLEHPDYFVELVREGGLRKLSLHVDMTMAGRPGFPIRELRSEGDLNPLRQQFVDLIHDTRSRTGIRFRAAHTITVTHENLPSLGEVVDWLLDDARRVGAIHMLSFQPEASVGRTRTAQHRATPAATWQALCSAIGRELPRDGLHFGHPDCSSWAFMLVDLDTRRVVNLLETDPRSRRFFRRMLETFGGVGSRGHDHWRANWQRLGALLHRPGFLLELASYAFARMWRDRMGPRFVARLLRGRIAPLNFVMHNFMSTEEIAAGGERVQARLDACAFLGAARIGGEWVNVPMCSMNALERETLYDLEISKAARETGGERDAAFAAS